MRRHSTRAVRLWACALVLLVVAGCNAVFDISKGTPRRLCADPLLIDDLEDGDGSICLTNGREGGWFAADDGTSTAELTPSSDFAPTLIEEGPRGKSRYAARLRGSGFTDWGAVLGVGFAEPGDVSGVNGIRFWMRSTTPISVGISTTETTPISDGGECMDAAGEQNCYNDFAFSITAPSPDWAEYKVPFNALGQSPGGSAIWNPRHVTNILFHLPANAEFDVSIDDLSFYSCANCQPTCMDPEFPVSCREGGGVRASCQPPGTDCAALGMAPEDPLGPPLMVALGGGDPGCVGQPSEQLPRCFLTSSAGIPFALRVNPFTDGVANAQLRNPEPGKVCMRGTMGRFGAAAITFIVSPIVSDFPPAVSDPFDLQALDIQTIEFTVTNAPSGGVWLELRGLVDTECEPGFYCLGPVFSLPNAFKNGTVRAEIAEFEPADPGPRRILSVYFWGRSAVPLPTNYDFCVQDVKFFDSRGELVMPPPEGGG